ncbi:uncharacterized protein [Clytia hemisphaerica]|uniref:uncharacterized protein isoform X2 n=1 Tax=Clytia hemisphaerica TaxID=252671 RepID=UPI0034D3E7BE
MSEEETTKESAVLWMGDISPEMDKDFVIEAFANMGFTAIDVKEMHNRNGERANYCFVDFGDVNVAREVLIKVDKEPIPGTDEKKFRLNRSEFGKGGAGVEKEFSLYVREISLEVTDEELLTFFQKKYSSVRAANIVRDSHEERYVQLDYFAKPKLYDTYDDVIDAVREEKVYAAVLPHDVATWRQHDIRNPNVKNPLAITGELDGQVPFDFLVHKDAFPKSEEIMDCIFSKYKYEIITSTMDMYKRRLIIETLYYGNADQIFEDNLPVQIGIGLAVAALFVSLLITLYNRSHQKTSISVREKKEKIEAVFDEMLVLMRDYREFVKVKDGVLDLKDEIKINIEKTG